MSKGIKQGGGMPEAIRESESAPRYSMKDLIEDHKRKLALTMEDKIKALADKNPALLTLIKTFDLREDF